MSFLKNNPIPVNPKNEFNYLSLFEAVRPDDIRGLTDAEATSLLGWLQERQQRHTALKVKIDLVASAGVPFCLIIVALATTLKWALGLPDMAVVVMYLIAGALFCTSMSMAIVGALTHGRPIRFETQADRLLPLNESWDGCSELLELVRSYPEVSAYRNDVIRAGRQLLQIDLEMAYALRNELDYARVEAAQLEACRQLHAV